MIRINEQRLWTRLQRIAMIGENPAGGVSRYAWTKEYRDACLQLTELMKKIGLSVRMDTVGNLFAMLPGKEDLPPVLSGSHLDTVTQGGNFDGIAGIMAAVEALNSIKEKGEPPRRPIEIVAFINEEACQFLGGCFGSKAMAGMLPGNYADTCIDRNSGIPLRQAMLTFDMGLEPDNIAGSAVGSEAYSAFLELHIEQGSHLLQQELPLAVVDSIAGIKQFYITIKGVSCHAGGMAMRERKDALATAAVVATEVERLALSSSPNSRGTVGYIQAYPAEHNIVANKAVVPVDFREDDPEIWARMYEELLVFTGCECERRGTTFSVRHTIDVPPCHCDLRLTALLDECASALGIPHTHMISYPAHDAMQMGRLFPMGMIFLRSMNGGLSHCPEEYTTPEDLAAGTQLLADALWRLANEEILS